MKKIRCLASCNCNVVLHYIGPRISSVFWTGAALQPVREIRLPQGANMALESFFLKI